MQKYDICHTKTIAVICLTSEIFVKGNQLNKCCLSLHWEKMVKLNPF